MIRINELFRLPEPNATLGESAYLGEPDGLLEAQVTDVRLYATTNTIGIILDLRTALQRPVANTGVLIIEGVVRSDVVLAHRDTDRTAWTVIGSAIAAHEGGVTASLDLYPDGNVTITGDSAVLYSGIVPDIGEIPNYMSATPREMEEKTAGWQSRIDRIHGFRLRTEPQ